MIYIFIGIAVILLIIFVMYLRIAKYNISTTFRAFITHRTKGGISQKQSLREATDNFRYRKPFDKITEDDIVFFVVVLQDLQNPVDAGANILQHCEWQQDISFLKDKYTLLRLAYSEDIKISIIKILEKAKNIMNKSSGFEVIEGVLLSLKGRDGWIFIKEDQKEYVFEYKDDEVRISKQNTGMGIAKAIIFTEMKNKKIEPQSNADYLIRKIGKAKLLEDFDGFFEEIFQRLSRKE